MRRSELWLSGRTLRSHTLLRSQPETIAHHSWGVLLILDQYFPEHSPRLWRWALYHDCPEYELGDLPAPTKDGELRELYEKKEAEIFEQLGLRFNLSPIENFLLDLCDRVEFLQSTLLEIDFGNSTQQIVADRIRKMLGDLFLEYTQHHRESASIQTHNAVQFLCRGERIYGFGE